MKTRRFGKEGIEISEVGLGCWQIGGNWGEVDEATARSVLTAAVESGVTFFDTANVYGDGRSESLIGKFLKEETPDELFIATKVGRGPMYPGDYTEAGVRADIEASLSRLGVETLDLVQTHCVPSEIMRSGEIYEWLQAMVDEGKIRRIGASVETVAEAEMLIENLESLYSLQVIFNVFRQKLIATVLEKAKEREIGIIARVPLASGLLSGKFSADTAFGEEDHRNFNKDGDAFNVGETFAGVPFDKGLEFVKKIESIVPEGTGLAEMALRWILDFDAVSTVIPGASRPEQAIRNASASDQERLSDDVHQQLKALYDTEIESAVRGAY